MFKVLLTDSIAPEAVDVFDAFSDIEAVSVATLDPVDLMEMLPEFDAIIVRSPTKMTRGLIEAGKKLKFIGRAGVGVDNIDVDAATARGITVMNSPGGNTISTAEHAIAMIMALARRVAEADASLRAGQWNRGKLKGVELFEKTLGVIGIGRVGAEVARRMLAFGMNVIAADPYVSEEAAKALGVRLVSLDTLLADSDFITIHVPLGADTKAMIGASEIGRMRDGVFVINCARGGVIDEKALEAALDSGKIAGVALDVFETEPPGQSPLLRHRRSVFTPHLGAATKEAQLRVAVEVARAVADALATGEIRNAVNAPR